jgi:uncharacterized protein with GYD domain
MCTRPHFGGQLRGLPHEESGPLSGAASLEIKRDGNTMTKYLFEANYVGEGTAGLMREGGTKRREVLVDALKDVGGTLESFYYAFGETDVLGIFEVPEQAGAAALSLTINSTGAVKVRLKPLMTPEDLDEAAKRTPSYRAPGR